MSYPFVSRPTAFYLVVALAMWTGACTSSHKEGDDPPNTPQVSQATTSEPSLDPKADAALKRMSQTLAGARVYSFVAHSTVDSVLDDGEKIQYARTQHITVRRPDGFDATVVGDTMNLHVVYDGKQLMLHNLNKPCYALMDAPPTIDATLDMLADEYGIVIPLADMQFADPYRALTEHLQSSRDLGEGYAGDEKCEHLACRSETVDWQIWIDSSNLPRKLVITYRNEAGAPQFTSELSDWNTAAQPPADAFRIAPPANTLRQDLVKLPATQPSEPASKG